MTVVQDGHNLSVIKIQTDLTITITLVALSYIIWIFTHLKLCLATAIHNFKWVEITDIY